MPRQKTFIFILFAVAALAVSLGYWLISSQRPPSQPANGSSQNGAPKNDAVTGPIIYKDLIKVNTPLPGQVVTSPLSVDGEARGIWFFEATFPIRLVDSNGQEIAVGYAQARDNWMTADYVPFEGQLNFKAPMDTNNGFLVLEKANASGLPEHADELRINIRFR